DVVDVAAQRLPRVALCLEDVRQRDRAFAIRLERHGGDPIGARQQAGVALEARQRRGALPPGARDRCVGFAAHQVELRLCPDQRAPAPAAALAAGGDNESSNAMAGSSPGNPIASCSATRAAILESESSLATFSS